MAPDRTRAEWFDLTEIGLAAIAFLCYFLVRGAVVDRSDVAIENARWIIDLQRSLGMFIEPSLNAWALESTPRVRFFNFVYFWLDFPLIVSVGLLLFWRSRRQYTLLRDALLISGAMALAVYWTFPVAPPRYLTDHGFVDTLEQFDNLSYQAQSMRPFVNPFAAVPSLHVGWSLLLAIVVFQATRARRWRDWAARAGALAVLGVQSVAVVATANHFVFDAIVGLLICAVAFPVAAWLQSGGYPRLHGRIRRAARARAGRTAASRVR